jgi:hypothetical protein
MDLILFIEILDVAPGLLCGNASRYLVKISHLTDASFFIDNFCCAATFSKRGREADPARGSCSVHIEQKTNDEQQRLILV